MVGRDELLEELTQQLADKQLVTVHGPGGIGKTTVAVALGHLLLNEFNGAVHFADLGLLSEPELVPGFLASALGLPVQSSDPASAVVNFLRDRRAMLILDSCEHLIDAVAGLAERIVQQAPQVSMVATSREPLRIEGEYVHRLSPLQSPPDDASLTAERTLAYPAAHLLVERAVAGNHLFELTDADAPLAAEICRKLDGIALAIELAAGWASTHGLQQTAALIDKRMKLLWRGRRTASPRHQTMMAALDWSYDLISERERTVLRRLSAFVGTFSLEAAQSVASDEALNDADVIAALEELAAKSLVSTASVTGVPMRYRLLDTTRAYARAKLEDSGEASEISRRHALYWRDRLERAQTGRAIAGESRTDGLLAQDLGNIRAALEHSFSSQGDPDLGIALAAAAAPVLTGFSLLSECCRWSEEALTVLGRRTRDKRREMELIAAFGHSMMFTRGNSDHAVDALSRGLELAEELDDRFYQFRLLSDLHMFRLRTGRYRDTLVLADRARAIAEEIGDPVGLSAAHRLLSTSHHLAGNQAQALSHLDSWQPAPSQVKDTSAFNASRIPRIGYARALWLLGFPDKALRALHKADEEAVKVQSPVPVCIVTIWGAYVLGWIGDWDAVDARADRLIAYARRYSLDPHIAVGNGLKGAVQVKQFEVERGIEMLQDSLSKLRADSYELYTPNLCLALAEGLGKCGRLDEAVAALDDTIAIVETNGGALDQAELLRMRGELLLKAGDEAGAEVWFLRALEVAGRQSALSLQLRAVTSIARLKLRQGHAKEAREELTAIHSRFVEGFATEDLRAAKMLLAEMDRSSAETPRRIS